jgi:Flp pilus assembly pilin Flp
VAFNVPGVRLVRQLRLLVSDESGQDVMEYALVTASIAVAVAATLILGFQFIIPKVLDLVCGPVDPLGLGNCLIS